MRVLRLHGTRPCIEGCAGGACTIVACETDYHDANGILADGCELGPCTITADGAGDHKHKKQTGGAGQFGEVHLQVDPLPRGAGFEFVDLVKGGAIPGAFIPAVEKGIEEALKNGIVAGYPMVDMSTQMHNETHRTGAQQPVLAPPNHFHRLEQLVTPQTSGNLRAPAIRVGRTLIVGFNELRGKDLFNTAIVLHKGHSLGMYSKCMTLMKFHTPGREFPVFERGDVRPCVV